VTARKKPAPSTALVRRVDDRLEKLARQVALLKATKVEVLPAATSPEAPLIKALESGLTDVVQLGELGFHPLTLTPAKEAVLDEPVDETRVLILPSGAVYYPHTEYTRWFNRGFGRAAWVVRPAAKPTLSPIANKPGKFLVTQVFVLFVHGKPVAQATGEGNYFEKNNEQTHADVVEALNASALRRLAKRLGIGLELWDRSWGRSWQSRFAVQVWVDGEDRPQWRRTVDPPFPKEKGAVQPRSLQGGAGGESSGQSRGAREPQSSDSRTITKGTKEKPGQVERLWAIVKTAGRSKEELKGYLRIKLGIESTGDILRRDYEQVIKDIQKPGPMLEAPDVVEERREPGEEG